MKLIHKNKQAYQAMSEDHEYLFEMRESAETGMDYFLSDIEDGVQ